MKKTKTAFKDTSDKTVPIVPLDGIYLHNIPTKNGNTIQVFYNQTTNLLVVDIVNKFGGNEILRQTLDEKKLLKHAVKGQETIDNFI